MVFMVNKKDITDFALAINGNGNGESYHFKDAVRNKDISISLDEVEAVTNLEGAKSDANMPNSPEASNFILAEHIKREYALTKVFSADVSQAHREGDIHMHKLGMIDRPYCSGQSPEYVKKYGLDRYSSFAGTGPAKHAEVFLEHLWKMTVALRARFSGAIGWDALNIFIAPYLGGRSDEEIYQLAQTFVYLFNQTTAPIGAQPVFSDINLYWEIPTHFADVPAIGSGGNYTGKKYRDYQKEAQSFVWQLFNVYKDGDAYGRPFFWPKPNLHITEKFWQTEGHEDFLEHVGEVSAKMGNPYYIFDRGETIKVSECCRVSFELSAKDLEDAKKPWRMRYNAAPYITPNLPRLAYRAKGKPEKFFKLLNQYLKLIFKAHGQKHQYVKALLDKKEKGPLSMLTVKQVSEEDSFLRLSKTAFLVGVLAVDDTVKFLLGSRMHENENVLKLGLKIVAFMKNVCDKESKRTGLKYILEQDPAEAVCYRFARQDLERFPRQAQETVHGDRKKGTVYYANSTHLEYSAVDDPLERIEKEGRFHPLIEGGNITHIWLGENKPSGKSVASLIKKTFVNTLNNQVAFSPEFTVCNRCQKMSRGLLKNCRYCGSRKVDGITRITGYYTFTSGWNKGKLGELKDRLKVKI
jgi:ribonucleoside-triphosphate reductase